MSIVVNIYYSGENGSARKFAKEMISSGTVDAIRNEAGNIREPLINHRYFITIDKSVRESSLSRAFSGFGFPVIRS